MIYILEQLINIICLGISAVLVKRIYEKITGQKQQVRTVLVIYITSVLLLTGVVFTQDFSICALVFILIGVDGLIDNSDIRFVVSFAIAACIDPYAVFLLIALVCLTERKVVKILIKMLCVCIPTLISGALGVADISSLALVSEYDFIDRILICWLIYFVIVLLCFISNKDIDRELRIKRIIYVCFITYMAIMSFMPLDAGVLMYIVPFEIMLIYINGKNYNINMILMTAIEVCLIITLYNNNGASYQMGTFVGDIMNLVPDLSLQMVITALYVVCGIEIAYINLPGENRKEISFGSDKLLRNSRIIVMLLLVALPIAISIAK